MSDIVSKKITFSTPFLQGYRELKIPIVDIGGNPAWPEMFPAEKIDDMRRVVGARHFSAQMMLDFVSPDRVRLDPGALHFYDDDFNPHLARIGQQSVTGAAIYWDPSLGRRKSDGSVCALIYRDDTNRRIFIHDIMYLVVSDEETHPMARQCENVLDFMRRCDLRRITVETNGIGNALPEILRDAALRRGADIVVQKISNNKRKEDRILDAIEPVLSSGRMFANSRVKTTPLMAEMLGWSPIGATGHDDGLDAVAGAIMSTPIPVRPIGMSGRIFSANTNFKI